MQTFTAPCDDEVADREAFEAAQRAAGDTGIVNGCRRDDTNVYFVTEPNVDEMTVRAAAFEAFYGKPMDGYQRMILSEALAER